MRLRHLLRLAHHAQDVPAGDLLDFLVLVAAPEQFGDQRRIGRHVLQPVDDALDAVEVAAEADVIDAGDLADVIDVVGGSARAWRAVRDSRSSTPSTPSAHCRGVAGKLLRQPRLARRSAACSTPATFGDRKPGTNVTMTTPPFFGSSWRIVVGHIARHVVQRPGGRVREDHRRPAHPDRVLHRLRRDVAQIDEHPEPVHLAHDFFAERRQAARTSASSVAESAHAVFFACVSVM